jgi:predicted NUDIX family phosphoesterase
VPEQVMVIPAAALKELSNGMVLDPEAHAPILETIDAVFSWKERDAVENDDTYKQVIPYLLVRCGEKWFLTRRTKKQVEARLHDKISLGVGGHVNPEDGEMIEVDGKMTPWLTWPADEYISGCASREMAEELNIDGAIGMTMLGYVNDDSTDVSRHHVGIIFEVTVAEERQVTIRETENMTGAFATREQIKEAIPMMENWSVLIAKGYVTAE